MINNFIKKNNIYIIDKNKDFDKLFDKVLNNIINASYTIVKLNKLNLNNIELYNIIHKLHYYFFKIYIEYKILKFDDNKNPIEITNIKIIVKNKIKILDKILENLENYNDLVLIIKISPSNKSICFIINQLYNIYKPFKNIKNINNILIKDSPQEENNYGFYNSGNILKKKIKIENNKWFTNPKIKNKLSLKDDIKIGNNKFKINYKIKNNNLINSEIVDNIKFKPILKYSNSFSNLSHIYSQHIQLFSQLITLQMLQLKSSNYNIDIIKRNIKSMKFECNNIYNKLN